MKNILLFFSVLFVGLGVTFSLKYLHDKDVKDYKTQIVKHNDYLNNMEKMFWTWEFVDESDINLDEEFSKEDMKNCWLSDRAIKLFGELFYNEYHMLHSNCMREKINPTHINWYENI